MSDEPPRVIVIGEVVEPALPRRIDDHWCEHSGCKKWGSFGFTGRYGAHFADCEQPFHAMVSAHFI